jgi:hypothetical protein
MARTSLYLGIAGVSLGSLLLEVSLTRNFSVSLWYHFAFLVVSVALFGIGASGTYLSLCPPTVPREPEAPLARYAFLFSLTALASFLLTSRIPFDPYRLAFDRLQILHLFLDFFFLSLPFFFSGLTVASALTLLPERGGRIYGADLLGAGLGGLSSLLLLSLLPAPLAVVAAALLGALAALAFSLVAGPRKGSLFLLLWLLFLSLLLIFHPPFLDPELSPYKTLPTALRYPDSRVLFTGWNAISRVDVVESPLVRSAPGLSLTFRGTLPKQLGITVDGDGIDPITRYETWDDLAFLSHLPSSVGYRLHEAPRVLVLSPGGGLEVLSALYHNASEVTAVEPNPLVADLMKGPFREASRGLYFDPRVRVIVGGERSHIRRDTGRYDVILLSLRGSPAAPPHLRALSENYLFTVEAFREMYDHLEVGGVLVVPHWVRLPPRETPRTASIAFTALDAEGVERPRDRVAAIRSWGTFVLLVRKGPFPEEELSEIRSFARENRFDLVALPDLRPGEVNLFARFPEPYYYEMLQALSKGEERERLIRRYLFDLTPTTDDRPFFSHYFRWAKILPLYWSMGEKWQPFVEGGYLVPVLFLQALLLSLLFILLPHFRSKGRWRGLPRRKPILGYFLCLGVGYIFVEIVLIQRFILFLGHPVYSVAAVLSVLLLSSGAGSIATSGGGTCWRKARPRTVLLLLVPLLLLYRALLPSVFSFFLPLDLPGRLLLSLPLIALPGFLMGMPFPLGFRSLVGSERDLIPWIWAANGCASVLGSILAVLLALSIGFSGVFLLAASAYGGALFLGRELRPEPPS